jgi:hypothetical protein
MQVAQRLVQQEDRLFLVCIDRNDALAFVFEAEPQPDRGGW